MFIFLIGHVTKDQMQLEICKYCYECLE